MGNNQPTEKSVSDTISDAFQPILETPILNIISEIFQPNLEIIPKYSEPPNYNKEVTNVYILKLTDDKYYVGKSNDPSQRYLDHATESGSAWTRKYKPLEIEKVIKNASHFDEDKCVKEYMSLYGIDNVRGGTYSSVRLTNAQKGLLTQEIRGAKDCCFRCGRDNHFADKCYAKTNVHGENLPPKKKIVQSRININELELLSSETSSD
uniref:CCHC-type domain-containing protein n=1 Tax=viral metagenome TaxID=1070528 RepID=A0A6C0C9M2_9ZZZZ